MLFFIMNVIKAVHGLIIQDRKILIVEKGVYVIFPGGKIGLGESDEQCLIRETAEELSGTELEVGSYYKTFTGITPTTQDFLESKIYFCYPKGEIGKPSNEINGRRFINSKDIPTLTLTQVSRKTLDSLIKDNLID
jgi:8-oxo-dGTP pyrophosphatase MutT (NUDIX family)